MKLQRSQNTVRNIKVSLVGQIISLLGPFTVRTVFIKTLGAEYLGLNSLFTSVLSVLSLAELGFGSAIAFSLYGAISRDDTELICAILQYLKKVYRIIGCIILTIGFTIIPILKYLVNGSYPGDINEIVIYLIFLGNSVLGYFLFGYYYSLISAFQRNDVISRIGIYMNLAMYVLQITLLLSVKNYYAYISIMPVFTIFSNITTALVAKKIFPQYYPNGALNKEIRGDIKEKVGGLMIQKVCQVSRNSLDSIFISAFLGLTEIAIYNNYYYIMNSVNGLFSIVTSAMMAGAGNSVASETAEKNLCDMNKMNFAYMWLGGWCACCLLCLYQPFMKIWMGEELMLPSSTAFLLCLYFYVLRMGDVRGLYADARGLWWQQRFRAILEATSNIILNYFMGKAWGYNGIIAATMISLFIFNFCYGSTIVFKHYFGNENCKDYFKFHAKTLIINAVVCVATFAVCSFLPKTLLGFICKIVICCILPNLLLLLIYRRTKAYRDSVPWAAERVGIKEGSRIWKLLLG